MHHPPVVAAFSAFFVKMSGARSAIDPAFGTSTKSAAGSLVSVTKARLKPAEGVRLKALMSSPSRPRRRRRAER